MPLGLSKKQKFTIITWSSRYAKSFIQIIITQRIGKTFNCFEYERMIKYIHSAISNCTFLFFIEIYVPLDLFGWNSCVLNSRVGLIRERAGIKLLEPLVWMFIRLSKVLSINYVRLFYLFSLPPTYPLMQWKVRVLPNRVWPPTYPFTLT